MSRALDTFTSGKESPQPLCRDLAVSKQSWIWSACSIYTMISTISTLKQTGPGFITKADFIGQCICVYLQNSIWLADAAWKVELSTLWHRPHSWQNGRTNNAFRERPIQSQWDTFTCGSAQFKVNGIRPLTDPVGKRGGPQFCQEGIVPINWTEAFVLNDI